MKALERLERVLEGALWIVGWTATFIAMTGTRLPWRR